jgi:hypothetical protein
MAKRDVTIRVEVVGDYYTCDETLIAPELLEQVQILLQTFCVVPDRITVNVTCDGVGSKRELELEGFR